MQPDSPETRIGRLETAVAKLEQRAADDYSRFDQRLTDLSAEIRALAPLVVAHAELKANLMHVQGDVGDLGKHVEGIERQLEKAETRRQAEREEQLKDSRNWRRALVIGSFTVMSAVIAAAATIIASAP